MKLKPSLQNLPDKLCLPSLPNKPVVVVNQKNVLLSRQVAPEGSKEQIRPPLTLVHERGQREPNAVYHRELILQYGRVRAARIRRLPLVRTEAPNHKQHERHDYERADHVDPELWRQRRQEREELGRLFGRPLIQDTDSQIQERISEINDLGKSSVLKVCH